MAPQTKELENDISMLEYSVLQMEKKLDELMNDKSADPTLIPKYVSAKAEAREQIALKTRELEAAKYKDKTKGSDSEQKKRKAEFDKKNNSYSTIRSSYPKSIDN